MIFAAAQGSELLQEHVVNSAGTARRAAAAAAETDDAAVLGDDEGDSSGAGAVCAGSEAVGVYGVFEAEGVYGDSAAAAGPSSQASSAEGVYGDPAVVLQRLRAFTVSSQLKASTVAPPPLQRTAEFLRLRALSFRESPEFFPNC